MSNGEYPTIYSCGCNNTRQNPCENTETNDAVSLQIEQLVYYLFGTTTKQLVDGKLAWVIPCDTNKTSTQYPRNDDEGFICYLIRLFGLLGLTWAGTYNDTIAYNKSSLVGYTPISGLLTTYIAIQDVPAGILPTDTAYWQVFVSSLKGDKGDPGVPAAPIYGPTNIAVDTLASNADQLFVCAATLTLTLLSIATADAGKYFYVVNASSGIITVVPSGSDTIAGAASLTLVLPGESVLLWADATSNDWRIL